MTKRNEELPPGQRLAPRIWPYVGERQPKPLGEGEAWRVSVVGLVNEETTWTVDELRAMPQVEQAVDIHCVTRWSKPGALFSGVPLSRLLGMCRPKPGARYVSFVARSERNHSASLVLEEATSLGALVTLGYEGRALGEDHGGPVRMVVPGRYFYKSVKWLERVELLAEDRLGYWEKEHGYHNVADPWRQERYIVPGGQGPEVRGALQNRDFTGKHFLSLNASGHKDLSGLKAEGALLRNANFRGVNLEGANFNGANLTNANLNGADLRHATFIKADVEGADFTGADLRGANFQGASLFGTTFCEQDFSSPALLDGSTYFDEVALGRLLSPQQEFVRRATGRPAVQPDV